MNGKLDLQIAGNFVVEKVDVVKTVMDFAVVLKNLALTMTVQLMLSIN